MRQLFLLGVATLLVLAWGVESEGARVRARLFGFVVAGQSNVGPVSTLPQAGRVEDGWISHRGGPLEPLEGGWRGGAMSSQWPWFGFALHDLDPRRHTLLITYWGGTCLVADSGRSGSPRWDPDNGDLYAEMVENVRRSGFNGTLDALLWVQGECDGLHGATTREYREALMVFADRVLEDLGLPVVVLPLSGTGSAGSGRIRAAQLQAIGLHPTLHLGPDPLALGVGFEDDGVHYHDVDVLGAGWVDALREAGILP